MRIAVCTKNDVFGATMLNRIVPALRQHDVAVFVGVRERLEQEATIPELDLMRMLERQIPNDLLFPLLDDAGPRAGRLLTPRQLATAADIPLTIVQDMQPDGGLAAIEAFRPDLILSVRFSYLFRRSTIAQARAGIVNVHPGPLPAYRGLFTPFWQMVHARQVLQCTVHLVDPGVDTGPVLAIEDVRVRPGRSLLWHMMQLYDAGVSRALDFIDRGLPEARRQDDREAGKYGPPTVADFARFRAMGLSLASADDYVSLLGPFVRAPAAAPAPMALR